MIKVPLDEAYVFDILTILLVKSKKLPNPVNCRNYHQFADSIRSAIGTEKLYEVFNSKEFENLRAANEETFEAVDLAKVDAIPASVVDQLNYRRYLCKKALQERFFDEPLTEQKIGYV